MGIKRPFTLFLCVILLAYLFTGPIFLFSINKDTLEQGKKEEVSEWEGVITMWDVPRTTTSGSTFGWLKTRISEFEEEHPGVFIDLRELNYDNNREIIEKGARADAKDRPDLLPLFVEEKPLPLENIEPLGDWLSEGVKAEIRSEFMQAVTYNSKIYALPFASSGNVLVMNTDLLKNIGCSIPSKKEWSYNEFIDFIQDIDKKKEQEDILAFDAYIGQGDGSIMPFILADGGQIFQQEEQRFSFYQPEMVSGFQKLLNIKEVVTTHSQFGIRNKNDVYQDFLENQKTAVLAADSSIIYTLERLKAQNQGFSYEVFTFPKGNMDIPIWYGDDISAYAMTKNQDQEKQKMIVKFLEFLVQEERQESLSSLGAFPVNQNTKELYDEDPLVKDWFKIGYEYQTHPLHPDWKEIEQKIVECIQSVITKENTPTQACKKLQMQLE